MADQAKEITISGEIIFTQDAPDSPLPSPSVLNVDLLDARRCDAPSITIAKVTVDAHAEYVKGKPLRYVIKVPNSQLKMGYSVSAVLNVGWRRDPSKDEWIRRGDYLNDTHHPLLLSDSEVTELQCDIEVIHYT